MKRKIYIILMATLTILILGILTISILYALKYNKKTLKEINRLEKIIELKQEINKENAYLFKKTENNNIDEEIKNLKYKIRNNTENIENLQNTVSQLQQENISVKEEIDEKQMIFERQLEASTVKIEREITYYQFPDYPTGCESVALYILLKYNGVDTTVDEIINNLKKGELPYEIEKETYGGNPEIEFVGDPRNDYSYGVFNDPIAEVANLFKENIQNIEGLELEQILEIVSQNRPVMVWTTIGNISSRTYESWIYRKTNEIIYWKENEHAVVIIGYNDRQVIVSDPYTGRITRYNRETFKENYNYMGKRAVYY